MSTEDNKALANRLVEEVINKGNFDAAGDYFTADYVDHATPPGLPPGLPGFQAFFTGLRTAFPDLQYVIDETIAEGDLVVNRATAQGTMKDEFLGMPATGKHAAWTEMHMVRIVNGKIVEHWANIDQLGMLQQLGLVPAPGQGG